MPRSKSAQKAARAAERKQLRNKSVKSATKTQMTQAEKLISNKDFESAQQAVVATISALDKAAKKGVIHPNTVARRKSRLMKMFNQAKLSSTAEKEPADTETT